MPKVRVQKSPIAGRGLFAIGTIDKNEVIAKRPKRIEPNNIVDQSPIAPYYSDQICIQYDEGHHIVPEKLDSDNLDLLFYANHSCNPNSGFDKHMNLVAMREIKTGEEVTIDYAMCDATYPGMSSLPTNNMECHCGALNCRKIIKGTDWSISELQHRYRKYFTPFVQTIIDKYSKRHPTPTNH